ncbi:polysaccharide deacetylase family protein [Candidatus Daviesbacteria bacterium]|nr:polysaccharide deacetylase family protein [Candidatus Daviesbacteria bacterium]
MTNKSKKHQTLHKAKHKQNLIYINRRNQFLLIILSFLLIGLFSFFYKNYQRFIFPEVPKDQSTPLQIPLPQIVEHGSRYQYKVALTFDADMTQAMQKMLKFGIVKSWYNPEIKKTLDKENAKATIFLTGLWVETYPKEAKALADDPLLEIGNHSYSHPAFTQNCFKLPFIDDSKDQSEVLLAQEAIKKATGVAAKYFRFPGGCFDASDLRTVNNLGLKVIQWDVAAGDGFNKDANSIIQKVQSRVQNGSIIVFHLQGDNFAPETNQALVKIIPFLKKRGYQLVKISELLNENIH